MTEELNSPRHCYACWNTISQERAKCSSGGAATALGRYVIENLGGVVFGVVFDDGLRPVYRSAGTVEELEQFKGSKYVQSILSSEDIDLIKGFLNAGRTVLFIGLPCQVTAVKASCAGLPGRLVTADMLCHGVMPERFFHEEIEYLKAEKGIDNVTDVRFRSNDDRNFHLSLWDGRKCVYDERAENAPYFSAYLWGIGLKEACYDCRFARPERTGDITLGDFIGLGLEAPFVYNSANVSFVSANTEVGESMVTEAMAAVKGMQSVQREYSERLAYRPSVKHPTRRHSADIRFRELLPESGFPIAIRKTLAPIYRKRWWKGLYVKAKRKIGIRGPLKFPRKHRYGNL